MLILLPLMTLALICFALQRALKSDDIRPVLLLGAGIWGLLLVIISELLSWWKLFNPTGIAAGWALALGAALLWAILAMRKPKAQSSPRAGKTSFSLLDIFHLAGITGIALLSGLIAVIAAPNNWDSMVYHLSRAMHWLQNGSVAFYPTHTLRQLYLPPWSEYLLAHVLALSEGDALVQLPQWFAMLGSVTGVSWIAKLLGSGKRGQIFAAFVTATLPMGILQSNTTQNDYVVTFWLICLAAFILQATADMNAGRHEKRWIWNLAIASSLGLALLTKSTAYIFALPFMLYYGISGLKHSRLRFLPAALFISVIVLAINLPHFSRNYGLFAHPLGPRDEVARYSNDPIGLKGTLSNIIRNTGMYLSSVGPVNQAVERAIVRVHSWMGLDVNDPRFTWSDHRFHVETPSAHEDTTASSLHLLLAVAGLILLAIKRKQMPSMVFLCYAGLVLAGFLLFCGYLRWQSWHPRLHLPLLVLSAAWAGLLVDVLPRRLTWVLSIVLALFVLPVFYFNPNKPLVADFNIFNLPRREVMIMRKNLVVPYIEGVNFVLDGQCHQVGLSLPDGAWEYPLWRLFEESGAEYRLEHINVENTSAALSRRSFEPCVVFAVQNTGDTLMVNGRSYAAGWQMDPVSIYVAE